ncbi:MAG TPA: hypothetical protein VH142_09245 [Polyangiaceae bacterium]|nr:hypothetical protein [Polyangiaceae bacterium]
MRRTHNPLVVSLLRLLAMAIAVVVVQHGPAPAYAAGTVPHVVASHHHVVRDAVLVGGRSVAHVAPAPPFRREPPALPPATRSASDARSQHYLRSIGESGESAGSAVVRVLRHRPRMDAGDPPVGRARVIDPLST